MSDIPQILDSLQLAPAVLAGLVRGIPAARLRERRGEGFWTIDEHLFHLAKLQPVLFDRFRRVLDEENPEFPLPPSGPRQPAEPILTPEESLAFFAEHRGRQLDLLRGLAPADWKRAAHRGDFDDFGLHTMVRHALLHDHWHMYRMEELWLVRDGFVSA